MGFSDKNIKEIITRNDWLIKVNEDLPQRVNEIIAMNETNKKRFESLIQKIENAEVEIEWDPKSKIDTDIFDLVSLVGAEYRNIMSMITDQTKKFIKVEELWESYQKDFPSNRRVDFNVVTQDLKDSGLIREFSDDFEGVAFYRITTSGLRKLSRLKRMHQEKNNNK